MWRVTVVSPHLDAAQPRARTGNHGSISSVSRDQSSIGNTDS